MSGLAEFLLNASWQLALIGVVAFAALRVTASLSAAHRHLLVGLALAISVGLAASHVPLRAPRSDVVPSIAAAPVIAPPMLVLPARIVFLLAALYAGFVLFRGARLARSLWLVGRVRRRATRRELPDACRRALAPCLAAIGVRRPEILWSTTMASPVTVGTFEPAIILPQHSYDERSTSFWTAVLGHELAHIRRRDFARNIVWELLTLPIAFHPTVIWLRRELERTREQACDEAVADEILDEESYALALVHVAGKVSSPNACAYSMGIGKVTLEDRIMRIVNRKTTGLLAKALGVAAAGVLVVTAATASAWAFTVVTEQGVPEQKSTKAESADERPSTRYAEGRPPYQTRGRRDPFVSPLRTKSIDPLAFDVESLALQGIVETPRGFTAMLEGPDRKTYFVKRGDSFFNGTLVDIDRESLTFRVQQTNPLGPTLTREVVVPLHREE